MTLVLLTLHTPPLIKTLMMKKKSLRRRHPRDDLRDLKVETPKCYGDLNLKNYPNWVQTIKRIFKLKGYNDEKSFKLVILKLKGDASLWYEYLRKSRAREAKSKIKTCSKLKKHMDERILPLLQTRHLPQDHPSQLRKSKGRRVH